MKDIFIIKFTIEEKSQNGVEKDTHILGASDDLELAINYLRKYYNHDVTNGDTTVKVVDEFIKTTERKNGEIECCVRKKYKSSSITYTEILEIVVPVELNEEDNPISDIDSFFI